MKKNVALVLSSGGARGMAHIGVIEEMEKNGFAISSLAGSSIGAVIGGIYSMGKLDHYKKWVCDLNRVDVFKLLDFTLTKQGFIKGEKVFNEMKKIIGDKPIENLPISFVAVASDMISQKEVVLDKGSLFSALRASIAIPTVFTPHKLNGLSLVDGGVLNPIPMKHIKRTDGDILVVVDSNAPSFKEHKKSVKLPDENAQKSYMEKFELFLKKWKNIFPDNSNSDENLSYFNLLNKVIESMEAKISSMLLEQYKPDIIVRIPKNTCGSFDFHRAEELIELGRKNFQKSLKTAKISA